MQSSTWSDENICHLVLNRWNFEILKMLPHHRQVNCQFKNTKFVKSQKFFKWTLISNWFIRSESFSCACTCSTKASTTRPCGLHQEAPSNHLLLGLLLQSHQEAEGEEEVRKQPWPSCKGKARRQCCKLLEPNWQWDNASCKENELWATFFMSSEQHNTNASNMMHSGLPSLCEASRASCKHWGTTLNSACLTCVQSRASYKCNQEQAASNDNVSGSADATTKQTWYILVAKLVVQ